MTSFTPEQWIMVILVFLLGLFLGGWIFAGPKWKRRYGEEVARREALERDYKHRAELDPRTHPGTTTTTTRPIA